MKNYLKLATVAVALVMVTAIVVTFEACRKDKISSNIEGKINEGIVYQQNIADRETYIIDFKKKYLSGSKSDEVMTAENANAFLFDLLNFDFCNLNVDYSHVTYETTSYDVSVKDGMIGIGDFAALYSQVSSHVREYYHSLNVINPNYLYMKPEIDYEDGAPTATVTVTAALSSGFYPKNDAEFDSTLCDHFPPGTLYDWEDAADTLEYYTNLHAAYSNSMISYGRYYFTNISVREFPYTEYPGMFNSHGWYFYLTYISNDDMCILLNNYINYARSGITLARVIVCVNIEAFMANPGKRESNDSNTANHYMTVTYGDVASTNTEPNL
ncbi:MAG: hypothetical protein MJZ78_03700 [Bacteroidales bacterium]|nr:hypothetical protein [Bacteroidales bacterium]